MVETYQPLRFSPEPLERQRQGGADRDLAWVAPWADVRVACRPAPRAGGLSPPL